jgi:hypothetical protein
VGGIILIRIHNNTNVVGGEISVDALDWNTKKPVQGSRFVATNLGGIEEYLNELTSYHYAEKIMEWIKANMGNTVNESDDKGYSKFVSQLGDGFKAAVLNRAEKMGLDGAFYFTLGEYMDKLGFDFDYENDEEQEALSGLIIQKFPELEF